MSLNIEHPLKGRFLIFRRWKPTYGSEYTFYFAIAPGESWGMLIRKCDSKEIIPYEIQRTTMNSALSADNEECTEEEFYNIYHNAIAHIQATVKHALRPIEEFI